MPDFTREELRDVMHAIRHYQIYHVSIQNPRYEEYNSILDKLEQRIAKTDPDLSQETFDRKIFLNWLEERQQEWEIDERNETQ
jgi:hypothetical protein|tara:strand:+ start:693 stop:941 length:249 start_codon:yes stop_codon:yes gene_type:complete